MELGRSESVLEGQTVSYEVLHAYKPLILSKESMFPIRALAAFAAGNVSHSSYIATSGAVT